MPTKEFSDVTISDCRILINGEWIEFGSLKEVEIIMPSDFTSDEAYNDFLYSGRTFSMSITGSVLQQIRTHRSKRVNKKWAKRYGYKW